MKGEVEIKILDKNGKVKKQIKANAISSTFAEYLINGLANGNFTVPKFDQIEIIPQTGNDILLNASASVSDTGTAWQVVFSASDSSSNAYTTKEIHILSSQAAYGLAHVSTTITKGATDVLTITWTVSQPYG